MGVFDENGPVVDPQQRRIDPVSIRVDALVEDDPEIVALPEIVAEADIR